VSFTDAVILRNAVAYGQNPSTVPLQRNRLDLNLNQTLGDGNGQLYVTASRIDYWNRPGSQVNYSVGYSNHFKSVNYSFSAQRTLDSLQNFGSTLFRMRPPSAVRRPTSVAIRHCSSP
jgi:outer membrane usher protein